MLHILYISKANNLYMYIYTYIFFLANLLLNFYQHTTAITASSTTLLSLFIYLMICSWL